MTPVLLLLTSELLPLFWEKNEFKEITLTSLKWRRTPFPFLDAEMQLRLKLHVIELETIHSYIFLLWTIFLDNIFLIIGSLMNACERELKLSNHDNENISGKCNLTLRENVHYDRAKMKISGTWWKIEFLHISSIVSLWYGKKRGVIFSFKY